MSRTKPMFWIGFNLLSYISKTKAQLTAAVLEARKVDRDDEFDIVLPDTLRIKRYRYIMDWYMVPENQDYEKKLEVDIAGGPHLFGWGGLHGAITNYQGRGIFLNVNVASFYPAIMIEYIFLSRNVADSTKYRQIRDERLRLKAEKNPMCYENGLKPLSHNRFSHEFSRLQLRGQTPTAGGRDSMEDKFERHIFQFVEAELFKYKINKQLIEEYDKELLYTGAKSGLGKDPTGKLSPK